MMPEQNTNRTGDPLIDEVREMRRRASETFDHDLDRLVDHLRDIESDWPGPKAPSRAVDKQKHGTNSAAA